MINVQELRIGNIVQYTVAGSNVHIGEITGINKTSDGMKAVIDYHYPQSFGSPIQLSVSWLERFGFIERPNCQDWYIRLGELESTILSYRRGELRICPSNSRPALAIPIEYVHLMQNCFYSLTGTELTIKEIPTTI